MNTLINRTTAISLADVQNTLMIFGVYLFQVSLQSVKLGILGILPKEGQPGDKYTNTDVNEPLE